MERHLILIMLLLTCLQFFFVHSYAMFLPNTDTAAKNSNLEYEDNKLDLQAMEEGTYYKMLSKLLIKYLTMIHDKDYVGKSRPESGMPHFCQTQDNGRSKRKVFWQPLGYLPPGASLSADSSPSSNNGKGNLFRYG